MIQGDVLTGVLGLAGLAGSLLRSVTTRGQDNISGDTVRDAVVGFALGVLWNVQIAGVWPVIDFREMGVSWPAAATIVAVTSYAASDIIALRVIGWIRGKAEQKTDQALSGTPPAPSKP